MSESLPAHKINAEIPSQYESIALCYITLVHVWARNSFLGNSQAPHPETTYKQVLVGIPTGTDST